jgi:cytochrome bd ubiquinol oxidase subunit I
MADLDMVLLSRLQFAFTIAFHIIFPSFTIGLASYLAVIEAQWLRTGQSIYRELYKFWVKIFAVSFGMGVVSGVVLSFQLGTNWSVFSELTGNVLGPLLGYEVLTAFFLEASFLGIMLFGWDKVGPKLHFAATAIVAVGTMISAFWILAANSWMQTPAGYELRDGVFYATSWLEVIFNPSFPYRFAHMLLAAFLTTSVVVASVAALHLLRGIQRDHARKMMKHAMGFLAIVVPLQIIAGHEHGVQVHRDQPVKLAAMEGHWETYDRDAPLVLFGWPNQRAERNDFSISVPKIGSLLVTGSFAGEIKGLKEWPPEDRPPVAWVFWCFRVMFAIGVLMLFIGWFGAWQVWRGDLERHRWFLKLCFLSGPTGFIAVISGWIVAEVGRQPWTVYGLLRTVDSASPVTAAAVGTSLIVFVFVYTIVFTAGSWYLFKLAWAGPTTAEQPEPEKPRLASWMLPEPDPRGRGESGPARG